MKLQKLLLLFRNPICTKDDRTSMLAFITDFPSIYYSTIAEEAILLRADISLTDYKANAMFLFKGGGGGHFV